MSTEMGQKGPLLRLSGLKTTDIPSPSASADELRPFLATLLEEAIPFLDSVPTGGSDGDNNTNGNSTSSSTSSSSPWKPKGTKRFPGVVDGPVDVTERVLSLTVGGRTETETWACRRSAHADAARAGTASWAEFVECLRDRHAETEDAFTPTVLGHRVVVAGWDGAGRVGEVSLARGNGRENGSVWGRFGMAVVEMKHKIPPPLKPRVFGVLQVTCTARGTDEGLGQGGDGGEGEGEGEFVVVSVPVTDLATGPWKDKAGLSLEKGVVLGAYAAVERVRRRKGRGPGEGEGEGGAGMEVEWVMATASDAKGVLPMWVQTKAVPGQVAKDVKLFLGWVDGERKKGTLKGVGGGGGGGAAAAAPGGPDK